MSLSIIPLNQIFGKYDQQTRMGELNRKNPIKTIQNQVDRVSISPEAVKKRAIGVALSVIQNKNPTSLEAESIPEENVEDISYTGRVIQDTLEKSKKLKNEDSLSSKLQDVPIKRSWKKFSNQSMDIKDKYVVEDAANKEGEHNNAATSSNDIKTDL
ncbi:MAG: hypothetical protein P8I98_03170 [Nitrospinaceae bacterium]|nr:hypothetical protein [Nitrospinaceae bacterium]